MSGSPGGVCLVASNGAGIGHLTRCIAIARRLPADVPRFVLTVSSAVALAREYGFDAHRLPSRGDGEPRSRWERRLGDELERHLEERRPDVVLFDGTLPYQGLIECSWRQPRIRRIWLRRALWKPERGMEALAFSPAFDTIIEPGDLASSDDRGLTVVRRGEAVRVPPIFVTDPAEHLSRSDALRALGLDPERRHLLVALGAGLIDDLSDVFARIRGAMQRFPDWRVAVASTSMTAPSGAAVGQELAVTRYPLAPIAAAFDASVGAAGYNFTHEMVRARVPTLFVPNMQTSIDDQYRRAAHLAARGVGLTALASDGVAFERRLEQLLEDRHRNALRGRLEQIVVPNGAAEVAEMLASLVGSA